MHAYIHAYIHTHVHAGKRVNVPRCGKCELSGQKLASLLQCSELETYFIDLFRYISRGCTDRGLEVNLSQVCGCLSQRVRVRVCVYVCMRVCMYVCMRVCMYAFY